MLRIPVFNGLRNKYEIAEAKEDEGRAAAAARAVEQTVINQVWTSWYDVKTAAQRIETSKDLLESATASEEVALGRYKEGVGLLLDLLNAQSALGRRAGPGDRRPRRLVDRRRETDLQHRRADRPGGSPQMTPAANAVRSCLALLCLGLATGCGAADEVRRARRLRRRSS